MSTKTKSFAESELNVLVKSSTDPENRPLVEPFIPEILALCEKFGLSGQSGGSAPYTAEVLTTTIKSLILQQPICPITGIDEEWVNVADTGPEGSEVLYQNSRCSALFKNEDGRCWYLDAIAWKTQNGQIYGGAANLASGEKMPGRQFIKGFPFIPKTFIVDVIEVEIEKDNWELTISNEGQLKPVFEYYQA